MSGVLNLVSVGPGFADHITPSAEAALKQSDAVVGYELYLKWIEQWIDQKETFTTPLTQERERALKALDLARDGKTVSLVSSGDIGVYAMASLAFEEMREDDTFLVRVVPGVTAANACASLLGAPLSHDFATLSLSDLLCPWAWIEERARHIARADLAVALYNVQSKQRQDGVYKILAIMQEHKNPETICGIVRNAYRPGETVEICTLKELASRQFDMLTTIVIGNRYTRRRRNWMYTPRGYNNWQTAVDEIETITSETTITNRIPEGSIWVFSGTSDGNALANELSARGRKVVVSAATSYGGAVAAQNCPGAHVLAGKLGEHARKELLDSLSARAIIDATHPYASQISLQLMSTAAQLGIPYIRFDRPSLARADHAIVCETMDDAALKAIKLGKRIFLSTGSKDLPSFVNAPGALERAWFVRVTPDSESIEKSVELGIPRDRICAMQGPFSREFNEILWRGWEIDCVVTKDSGSAGGYENKIEAAKTLGIPVIVISRPEIVYPCLVSDHGSLFEKLSQLGL